VDSSPRGSWKTRHGTFCETYPLRLGIHGPNTVARNRKGPINCWFYEMCQKFSPVYTDPKLAAVGKTFYCIDRRRQRISNGNWLSQWHVLFVKYKILKFR
jgi:hypothetical protein